MKNNWKATYNSVWQKKNGISHPTVKNTECLSWLIQLSSMEGELVFDGFLGAGSTAVAAKQADRTYLGAEIDGGYFAIAEKRAGEAVMVYGEQNAHRGSPYGIGRD